MSNPFGPDDNVKLWSREMYVGNEADSDEYRETQPWKLLSTIGTLADQMPGDRRAEELFELIQTWVASAGHSYEGSDEAAPLLAMIHDILWDAGEHPYYGDYAELLEMFELSGDD